MQSAGETQSFTGTFVFDALLASSVVPLALRLSSPDLEAPLLGVALGLRAVAPLFTERRTAAWFLCGGAGLLLLHFAAFGCLACDARAYADPRVPRAALSAALFEAGWRATEGWASLRLGWAERVLTLQALAVSGAGWLMRLMEWVAPRPGAVGGGARRCAPEPAREVAFALLGGTALLALLALCGVRVLGLSLRPRSGTCVADFVARVAPALPRARAAALRAALLPPSRGLPAPPAQRAAIAALRDHPVALRGLVPFLSGDVAGAAGVPAWHATALFLSLVGATLGVQYAWAAARLGKEQEPLRWALALAAAHTPLVALWVGVLVLLPALPSGGGGDGGGGCCCALTPRQCNLFLRKAYHVAAVVMFLPPVLGWGGAGGASVQDGFFELALAVAVEALVVVELARALRVRPLPLSDSVHAAMARHTDEREAGGLLLTHIYLLVGCAAPLWLLPPVCGDRERRLPELLAGVLSLGVGDAAAAVGGTLAGLRGRARTMWGGASKKSLEGSTAFVAATLAVGLGALAAAGRPLQGSEGDALAVAAVVSALCEALTDAVDNAVVPVVGWFFAAWFARVEADWLHRHDGH
jgi:dolichol kinase